MHILCLFCNLQSVFDKKIVQDKIRNMCSYPYFTKIDHNDSTDRQAVTLFFSINDLKQIFQFGIDQIIFKKIRIIINFVKPTYAFL